MILSENLIRWLYIGFTAIEIIISGCWRLQYLNLIPWYRTKYNTTYIIHVFSLIIQSFKTHALLLPVSGNSSPSREVMNFLEVVGQHKNQELVIKGADSPTTEMIYQGTESTLIHQCQQSHSAMFSSNQLFLKIPWPLSLRWTVWGWP